MATLNELIDNAVERVDDANYDLGNAINALKSYINTIDNLYTATITPRASESVDTKDFDPFSNVPSYLATDYKEIEENPLTYEIGIFNDIAEEKSAVFGEVSGKESETYDAVSSIGGFVSTEGLNDIDRLTLPTIKTDESSYSRLEEYSPPVGINNAPTLMSVSATFNDQDSLSFDNLFTETIPSSELPLWDYADLDIGVDAIIAELNAVSAPVIDEITFPGLTKINIPTIPAFEISEYEAGFSAELPDEPQEYNTFLSESYETAYTAIKEVVDNKINEWLESHEPNYFQLYQSLNDKLNGYYTTGEVLHKDVETAIYERAKLKVIEAFESAEKEINNFHKKRGFTFAPGAVFSAINRAQTEKARGLAANALEIYTEKRRAEVQHLQFIMTTSGQLISSARDGMMKWASLALEINSAALERAKTITGFAVQAFDHIIARHKYGLEILSSTREQYKLKVDTEIAKLETYKQKLAGLSLLSESEMRGYEAIKLQIQSQELKINRYAKIIDAISQKAAVKELVLKEANSRRDVFVAKIEAYKAERDAYQTILSRDKGLLDTQLAKLDVYTKQVETEVKKAEIIALDNESKVKQFEISRGVFESNLKQAVEIFTNNAELAKIAIQSTAQTVDNEVKVAQAKIAVSDILLKENELLIRSREAAANADTRERALAAETILKDKDWAVNAVLRNKDWAAQAASRDKQLLFDLDVKAASLQNDFNLKDKEITKDTWLKWQSLLSSTLLEQAKINVSLYGEDLKQMKEKMDFTVEKTKLHSEGQIKLLEAHSKIAESSLNSLVTTVNGAANLV